MAFGSLLERDDYVRRERDTMRSRMLILELSRARCLRRRTSDVTCLDYAELEIRNGLYGGDVMRVGDQVELKKATLNVPRGARGTVVDVTQNGCHVAFSIDAGNTADILALRQFNVWLIDDAARALHLDELLQGWCADLERCPPAPPIDSDACRMCGALDGWADMLRELRDQVAVLAREVDELQRRGQASVELPRPTPEDVTAGAPNDEP